MKPFPPVVLPRVSSAGVCKGKVRLVEEFSRDLNVR